MVKNVGDQSGQGDAIGFFNSFADVEEAAENMQRRQRPDESVAAGETLHTCDFATAAFVLQPTSFDLAAVQAATNLSFGYISYEVRPTKPCHFFFALPWKAVCGVAHLSEAIETPFPEV